MRTGFHMEGAADLDRALRELVSASSARRIGARAAEAALEPVKAAAIAAAPRAAGGGAHYADTIGIGSKLKPSQAKEERKVSGVKEKDLLIRYVGSSSPLAHLIEFGTGPRRQTSTGRFVGSMPPQPVMRMAWEANKAEVLVILSRQLRVELEKTLARIARRASNAAGRAAKAAR